MSDDSQNTSNEKSGPIPGFQDVNTFTQQALKSVLQATRASNDLPAAGDDFDYYSSFQGVRDILDIEGKRVLNIIQNVLRYHNVKGHMTSSSDAHDLEDKFDVLMDANDHILEKVGSYLDESAGLKKKEEDLIIATATPKVKQASTASWNKRSSASPSISEYKLLTARNIQRPQLKFRDKIDNENRPFVPRITEKPNALQSLEESLKLHEDITPEMLEEPDFLYPHPYKFELRVFKPIEKQLQASEPIRPLSTADTPLTFVSTVTEFQTILDRLRKEEILAVDLEHHSYRTFQGITCLMQISTATEDFLIDTLSLRNDLSPLNEILTNPAVVKVFHGADSDIDWLQRDFGLYVVNMFDTGQAARVLNHARFSLAHLMEHYCNVTTDKQYQLADWRIRPLPEELMQYARDDTHYLLYIYHRMKQELLARGNDQKNLLMSVLQRSTEICAKVYKKAVFKEDTYLELYKKSKKVFNSRQLQALQKLYQWRDKLARVEDESTGYVLPNHMLLQIAEILPREQQGIFACCTPIPPLVRQFLPEIHKFILEAREAPLIKVSLPQEKRPSSYQHPRYDPNSLLNCHHDLSHMSESQQSTTLPDVSMVTKSSMLYGTNNSGLIVRVKASPLLTAFGDKREKKKVTKGQRIAAALASAFLSPFTKFLPDDGKPSAEKEAQSLGSWTLKKNTKRKERSPSPPKGPPPKKVKPDPVSEQIELSVREMTIQQRQRDREKEDHVNLKTTDDDKPKKKKKKKKEKREKREDAEFAAFDYSQADQNMFLGGDSKKKKPDVFNPYASLQSKGTQKVGRSSQSFSRSQKSHSYKQDGKGGGRSHNWPKQK
ncbi:exosome complex component 10-like [Saccostrea echinata]|uniref:exosome complex component 10-like n=1 Tax=Saccostrea echinata TaxID=191078 RepID=UPI002A7F8A9B|nr:exosome complex component 10-like [Saccostrea echinata]